ncbi:uncharacterized protein EAF01_011857 [Botrytis porri]|uniref:Uncharacterized protein n=1 Tax=Botrytis porri TaxID=87229 RepID=A0A4Z1KPL9_9HELO|nr:uncharacterized protein EAF01_011857 [Botrytis porri]KAF7881346.1 hypothetical protein EAF01_011857 [Botrytis porri]TGO83379.1 hypothetical protein BPOR_0656g00020 [Botrytis porri]
MSEIPQTQVNVQSKTKPFTEKDIKDIENDIASKLMKVAQGRLGIIHDFEFFWKNGERYVYSPDIGYYDTKVPEYKEEWNNHDCYYVSTMKTKSLSYIDRPKSNSAFVSHISERQWHLPRSHPHHLVNFSQDILDLILGFKLVIKDHTITPDVTLSNKRSSYKVSQSYTLDGKRYEPPDFYNSEDSDHLFPLSTTITKKHHDSNGAYFMIHKVYRPMIDATILRVCKTISIQGTRMLYAKNVFQFSMTQLHSAGSPGYLAFGKVHKGNVTLKHYTRR